MSKIARLEDLMLLKETFDVECKAAAGRNGKGQLPDDFWPTYSAFANTRGGTIFLGIVEVKRQFQIAGIEEPDRVKEDIFNLINNPQKVSCNVLGEDDVSVQMIDGKAVVCVQVRRARRKEKPVYVNSNPMTGTYRRIHDGDRKCDPETVKRFLAEQVEDSRDNRIIKGFQVEDLDEDSINIYRQSLRDAKPSHVALEKEGVDFLRMIGAWRRDRETDESGITAAGLLMFGNFQDIWNIFPNYIVDYQEQIKPELNETRWIDRLTLDGNWSGNLYDFYRRTYRKLVAELKVPFTLEDGRRKDETEVHKAIREALVNCIIHADYSASSAIRIVKRPDAFIFSNPGLMRIPPDLARHGGDGDARNRSLQQMFFLVGASDRAGTGVPTIYRGWREQGWLPPSFAQIYDPSEQTKLDLKMADLLPPSAIEYLKNLFGERFSALNSDQRLALATAATEKSVTNSRLQDICNLHRTDINRMLQNLVKEDFLLQYGRTNGTFYTINDPSAIEINFDDLLFDDLDEPRLGESSKNEERGVKHEELTPFDEELGRKSEELAHGDDEELAALPSMEGERGSDQPLAFVFRTVEDLQTAPPALISELRSKALRAARHKKIPIEEMKDIVCDVCSSHYFNIRVLAELLSRNERYLRDKIITPLIDTKRLKRSSPNHPNDPRQTYTSIDAT